MSLAANDPQVQVSNTAPLCQIGTVTPGSNASLTLPGSGPVVTIDWLTMVQEHDGFEVPGPPGPGDWGGVRRWAPIRGDQVLLFVDPDTGEIESQAVKSLQHEGSFASKLLVRSDGRRVEVSGNPSRWGVPHTLDGLTDLDQAVALYNQVLAALGLPGFSSLERADRELFAPRLLQRGDSMARGGCRITRIDLAQCFETGGPEYPHVVIRALGQVVHQGKVPMVYSSKPNAGSGPAGLAQTVAWGGGSRHVYVKYYSKGPEMLAHGSAEALPAAKWAMAVGLVRHEVTLKSMWLARQGLDTPSKWTGEVMRRVISNYAMHTRVGVARTGWARIQEQLEALDVPSGRARRAQEAAYAYLGGHVFRKGENIPVRSFYRLRADLRLVGLDISAPLNVSALQTSVRVVEMRPAYLPVGFRRVG